MIDTANWDKSKKKPFIKFTFIPQSRVLYKSSDGGKSLIIRNFTRVRSATTVFWALINQNQKYFVQNFNEPVN